MERKLLNKVRINKPLRTYSGEVLPAGAEITVTDDWETAPYNVRGRVILNPQGEWRLVAEEDLDYAFGAH